MPITAPPPRPDARGPYRVALAFALLALLIVGWAQAGGRVIPWARVATPALIVMNLATGQFGLVRRWPILDRLAPFVCVLGALAIIAGVVLHVE